MYHKQSKIDSMSQSLAEKLVLPMKGIYLLCLVTIGVLLLLQKEPLNGTMYSFGMTLTELKVLLVFLHVCALVGILMACNATAISSAAKGMVFFLGVAVITYMNEKDLEKINDIEGASTESGNAKDLEDKQELTDGIINRRKWYYVLVLFSFVSFLYAGSAETSIYGSSGFFVFSALPLIGLFNPPPLLLLEV